MERADYGRPAEASLGEPAPGSNPLLAAILSLIVPGLGQMVAGRPSRGLVVLLVALVVLGLILWLDSPILLLALAPFWLWNARDAYLLADGERPNTALLFVLGALPVYIIGWQVTQIDVGRLIRNAPAVRPVLTALAQPRFVQRNIDLQVIEQRFLVPCPPEPPPLPAAVEGPALIPSASCGAIGDPLELAGVGFPPNEAVELWWVNPVGARGRLRVGGSFEPVVASEEGTFVVNVVVPRAIEPRVDQAAEAHRIEARYTLGEGNWELTQTFWLVVGRMGETIAQGLMATFVGSIFAAAISFFGARNLMAANPITRVLYYVARILMNILRAIEPLIMAIVFVVWVGLGPFAGVLALMVHTVAALGKLYSEAIESIEPGPIEAIRATGANQMQTIFYAVLPQVLPPWIAFTVYRWDINVRMSTIIGFVGGGGIGFLLAQWIRLSDFRSAAAAIWAIAIVVIALDYISARVRERVI